MPARGADQVEAADAGAGAGDGVGIGGGAVLGRAVIDDDDLEAVEILGEHGAERRREQVRAVAGGDDDREQRARVGLGHAAGAPGVTATWQPRRRKRKPG
jgi:hypothetical protein